MAVYEFQIIPDNLILSDNKYYTIGVHETNAIGTTNEIAQVSLIGVKDWNKSGIPDDGTFNINLSGVVTPSTRTYQFENLSDKSVGKNYNVDGKTVQHLNVDLNIEIYGIVK